MVKQIVCPLVFLAVLLLAFAQMFYTMEQTPNAVLYCKDVCTIGDFFFAAYLLLLRNPQEIGLVLSDDIDHNFVGIISLLGIFTFLAMLIFLSVLRLILVDVRIVGANEIALDTFWVGMLNSYYMTKDISSCMRVSTISDGRSVEHKWRKMGEERTSLYGAHMKFLPKLTHSYMYDYWKYLADAFPNSQMNNADHRHNFRARLQILGHIWILRFVGMVILPAWFVLGLATLGILWPPQVRMWLFCPGRRWKENLQLSTKTTGEIFYKGRNSKKRLRAVHERSEGLKNEILDLKQKLSEVLPKK